MKAEGAAASVTVEEEDAVALRATRDREMERRPVGRIVAGAGMSVLPNDGLSIGSRSWNIAIGNPSLPAYGGAVGMDWTGRTPAEALSRGRGSHPCQNYALRAKRGTAQTMSTRAHSRLMQCVKSGILIAKGNHDCILSPIVPHRYERLHKY